MKMHYVTDERGGAGRYVEEKAILAPAPAVALSCVGHTYRDLGDGRVHLVDKSGESLGLFASRAIADRTAAFLAR